MHLKAADFASVFAALTDESDDFPYLVQKYKLDLARDFVGADLRNVNFGALSADILNLSGANLIGADLSSIKCNKLITDSAELKNTKLPLQHAPKNIREQTDSTIISEIKGCAILAIHSYVEQERVRPNPTEQIFDSGAPEYVEYSTKSEKVAIEKNILAAAQRLQMAVRRIKRRRTNRNREFGSRREWNVKVVRFASDFSSDRMRQYQQVNSDELDRNFLDKFAHSIHLESGQVHEYEPIFKKYSPEYESIKRDLVILKSSAKNTWIKRATFKNIIQLICEGYDQVTVLFVDFRPFSEILYRQINHDIKTHIKFIFVGPHAGEFVYGASMVSPDHFIHGYAPARRRFAETDLSKILKRVNSATNGRLLFSTALSKHIRDLIGLEINSAIRKMAELVANAVNEVENKKSPKLNRRGQLYIH
jgi:hypothetical protein